MNTRGVYLRKIAYILVFAVMLPNIPHTTSSDELPFFLLEAKPGCYNTLLTFENFPESASYEVWRGDSQDKIALKTVTFANWHLDQDNTNQGRSYYYQIKAKNDKNEAVAQSNIMQAKNTCPSEDSCSTILEYTAGSFMYSVNGRQEGPMDAAPEITMGKMFLVIRYVTKEVEASVAWDAQNKRITITTWDNKTIVLWIGQPDAMVGSTLKRIDPSNAKIAPYIKKGRTYLPMRFVAESLGCNGIEWVASQSLAKLSMKKPKCFDLNSFNITTDSYDPKAAILKGHDDTGCQLNVMLSEPQIETAKKLKGGSRVKIFPLEFNKTSDVPEFKSKYLEMVDLKDAEEVKGKFVKSTDYSLTIADCDGKEQTFRINMPLQNIKLLTPGDSVVVYQKERSAYDVQRVLMDVVCSQEKQEEVRMRVEKVNCRNGYISGKLIGKTLSSVTTVMFFKPDSIVCNAKIGLCYTFKCKKDQYGRLVALSLVDASCPYNIEIGELPKQYTFFPKGSKCSLMYRLLNKENTTLMVDTLFEPIGFEPSDLEMPRKVQMTALGYKDISITFKLDNDYVGLREFRYGFSDRGVESVKIGQFKAFDPDFDITEASGNFTDAKDVAIKAVFRITNNSDYDLKMSCFANPENENMPATIRFPVTTERQIPAKSTRDISFEVSWKNEAQPGSKHKIIYGASCGSKKISKELILEARKGGPYVRVNEPAVDESGTCRVFFEVDWKIYEKDKVTIDWGDGKIQDVTGVPVTHKYVKRGVYTIKVTAYAKTGETGIAITEAIFESLKPTIFIDEIIRSKDTEDKKLTVFTITGSVEWNGLDKGSVSFDWGDGSKVVTGDFPQTHKYFDGTYHLTITAKAKTGEETTKTIMLQTQSFLFERRPVADSLVYQLPSAL